MKKYFKWRICMCVSLVIGLSMFLCGCGGEKHVSTNATESLSAAVQAAPVETAAARVSPFAEAVLDEAAVKQLVEASDVITAAEQITNVEDAICYMRSASKSSLPEDACHLFAELVGDDCYELGLITLSRIDNQYTLVYIQHEDVYYAFSPFDIQYGGTIWPGAPESDADLDMLCENLMTTFSYNPEGAPMTAYSTQQLYAPGLSTARAIPYAEQLGEPVLKKAAAELGKAADSAKAAEQINNVGDAIYYMKALPEFDQPEDACQLFLELVGDDYDEAGVIKFLGPNESGYSIAYIQYDGYFYPLDPFRFVSGRPMWVSALERGTNLNLLCDELMDTCPYGRKGIAMTSWTAQLLYASGLSNADGIPFASVLGEPVLGETAMRLSGAVAAERITNAGDAIHYMKGLPGFDKPENACQQFAELIGDDYDEVGVIRFFGPEESGYAIAYIQHDDMFYPVDPFRIVDSKPIWGSPLEQASDLEVLCENLMRTCPYGRNGASMDSWITERLYGSGFYNVEDILYASELGGPVLGEAAAELSAAEAVKQITNVGDAIHYMKSLSRFDQPEAACRMFAELLRDNYDETGMIEFRGPANSGYAIAYIQHEGVFYPLDPFRIAEGRSFWDSPLERGTDLNTLCEKIMTTCPYGWDGAAMTSYQTKRLS